MLGKVFSALFCRQFANKRWRAQIWYHGSSEPTSGTFEEFSDLAEFLEKGPDFYTVERIEITINPERRTELAELQSGTS